MQPGGGCDSQQLQQQQGPVVLTQTSSHWLTQRTNRDSRRSRTSDSSLASRRMRSARPACRIWKLSLKSCNRRVAVQMKPAFATGTEIDRKREYKVQSFLSTKKEVKQKRFTSYQWVQTDDVVGIAGPTLKHIQKTMLVFVRQI